MLLQLKVISNLGHHFEINCRYYHLGIRIKLNYLFVCGLAGDKTWLKFVNFETKKTVHGMGTDSLTQKSYNRPYFTISGIFN